MRKTEEVETADVIRQGALNIIGHFGEQSDEVIDERMAVCSGRGDSVGEQMWRELKKALPDVRSEICGRSEPRGTRVSRPGKF